MQKTIFINKPIGYTPLECIHAIKKLLPQLQSTKIAYAGRLDPMAEGLLLLLVEPETKKRDMYQKLDKEYIFEVLFGVKTDTYDILGLVNKVSNTNSPHLARPGPSSMSQNVNPANKSSLTKIIQKLIGQKNQSYPPYSSARVSGKPLFWWARKQGLQEITIPSKQIEVFSLKLISINSPNTVLLKKQIIKKVQKVKGDFRQGKIIKSWSKFFECTPKNNFQIAKFKIHCSSGTYVRSIANEMGKILGTRAVAYSIKRTKIGKYKLKDAISLQQPFPQNSKQQN